MNDIYKTQLLGLKPDRFTEILQFLIVPFFAMVVFIIYEGLIETYQIVILIIMMLVWCIGKYVDYINRTTLHVKLSYDNKLKILIKSKNETIDTLEDIKEVKYGWNYSISDSVSMTKVFSTTHRTNHNLVLKIKTQGDIKNINFLMELSPWQSIPAGLPYLNDLDPKETNYQIRKIKKLYKALDDNLEFA